MGNANKRALDIALGVALSLITLPVVVFTACASAICLRAWPFFAQDRVGRGGKPFRIVKIRTLPPAAPRYIDKYALDYDAVPAPMRWLRRVHLDELPQLYLAVLGTMSLVGPRPEMRHLHDQMPESIAAARVTLRPGCTGLWQVSERSQALIHEGAELDLFYIDHQSLRFDVWLLWRTVRLAIQPSSCVSSKDLPGWLASDEAEEPVPAWVPPTSAQTDASIAR